MKLDNTSMQFTSVLYRLLIRIALGQLFLLLVLYNLLVWLLASQELDTHVAAQAKYLSGVVSSEKSITTSVPLSAPILSSKLFDANEKLLADAAYAESWSETESYFSLKQTYLVVGHKTVFSAYFPYFALASFAAGISSLILIVLSHKRLSSHWRVLLQLELWATKFSRNNKFRFFLKSHDYQLINSIRELNRQRLVALRGGQKVDHFIRSETFLDKDSRLGNRLYFEQRLESILNQEDNVYGCLLIVQYSVLDVIQEQQGKAEADEYLKRFSDILKQYLDDTTQTVVARINAHDFAVLLPYVEGKEVERIAVNILSSSQKLQFPNYVDTNFLCHIGVDMFSHLDTPFQIMAEADMALRAAQLHGPSGWFMYDSGELPQSKIKGSVRWRVALENAISKQKFGLTFQPVINQYGDVHHHEVLVRMKEAGEAIGANVFLPMARNCGLTSEVDKQVLTLLSHRFHQYSAQTISVNIHIDSWLNREFGNWLIKYLKAYPDFANKIIFEIPEFELTQHAQELKTIMAAVKRYKTSLTVDQVGLYVVDTEYLNHFEVDHLKLHQSLINQIHLRPENQTFVRSLRGVLSEQTTTLFASGVESENERDCLKRLGVFGWQGHFISEPIVEPIAATRRYSAAFDR